MTKWSLVPEDDARIINDIEVLSSDIKEKRKFILPTFEVLINIFPTLNYTVENANNNINEWQKLVDAHRLKGWTPRNIKQEENKLDKNNKTTSKNNYQSKENSKKNMNSIENNKLNKERENILRPNIKKWKPEKINIK